MQLLIHCTTVKKSKYNYLDNYIIVLILKTI